MNRWLAGEDLMTDVQAAKKLIQRARVHLSSSLRTFGIFSETQINSLFAAVSAASEVESSPTEMKHENDQKTIIKTSQSKTDDLELTSCDFFSVC
ncbi:unnamed protein product [Gongylonema pulchrum]|uniref:Uncharacterized protein n=1 Tax=Gongylonema pulchrum TaxID=637853 RepID=A0A3P6RWU8_9BILA|nr:unnamed protein product [Gongylonema pulchrum]